MAEPLLQCPSSWLRGTLEPDASLGLILRAESGGTPSTTRDEYWDGGIPWLTPKEITDNLDGLFVSRTERTISPLGLASSAAKLLPANTVMLSKRAPVGPVAVAAIPMATNQGFLNFTCGPRMRPLYLAYWLRANTDYLQLIANGSTYPELYKNDLFEFEISVPTIEEQDRILSVISALQFAILLGLPLEQSATSVEMLTTVQKHDLTLREIRDALLPLLLSGKVDVARAAAAVGTSR